MNVYFLLYTNKISTGTTHMHPVSNMQTNGRNMFVSTSGGMMVFNLGCETPAPSDFPTPFPSDYPTPFPSDYPTPFPSDYPTPPPEPTLPPALCSIPLFTQFGYDSSFNYGTLYDDGSK